MKTLELKLKKDVLIVDAISEKLAYGIIFQKLGVKTVSDYEFLCKGSELTEEIASELVDKSIHNNLFYKQYNKLSFKNSTWFHNPIDSFISAIVSKGFYWLENPISLERVISYESVGDTFKSNGIKKVWQEAEEKTFRNPLIFVKK